MEFESLPSAPVESAYNEKEFATQKKYYMELSKTVERKFQKQNFCNHLYQSQKVYKPKYHYFHDNKSYCLHAEIIDFVKWISPTEKSQQIRLDLIKRIKKAICGLWENCIIETYGSFESKTYLPKSDIDLSVFLKNRENESELVMELGKYLRRDDNLEENKFKNIRWVSNARVPIVKFLDEKTCIDVDISFNSRLGKENCKLIKRLLTSFPALRPLLFVLKHFLSVHFLDKPFFGGLSTYTLILMITSHLQLHPSHQTKNITVNLGTLLIDFFEVYSKFNFITTGISTNGKGRYFNKILMCVFDIQNPTTFYVQDPIQIFSNAARSSYDILTFLKSCFYAKENLTKNHYLVSIFKTNFIRDQSGNPILNQKLIKYRRLRNYFVRSSFHGIQKKKILEKRILKVDENKNEKTTLNPNLKKSKSKIGRKSENRNTIRNQNIKINGYRFRNRNGYQNEYQKEEMSGGKDGKLPFCDGKVEHHICVEGKNKNNNNNSLKIPSGNIINNLDQNDLEITLKNKSQSINTNILKNITTESRKRKCSSMPINNDNKLF
ncbi:inactive non-canonical poly(a) RNA polymerase protein trf4-2-related [Anaeramoeba flamelloides]|uniref:Inactive non-canonical poly(A) RNA polymerase protein trf4-2-related n=1 Tax=Anaeramoeba flamelloides TaxID=1746091 RepID=A0ABQ8ZB08_9EUKA|nr:inactive non-canonical poly(a) RNA polymerase protein trf4-2-related [Anaeramoeba flamelloides]